MKNIRAFCSDIDGTLLDKDRQLSMKTIETIRRLPANVPFILASSRMPQAMTHLQAELGIKGQPLICYNGGYVIQYEADDRLRVFENITIPLEVCESILGMCRQTNVHVSLYHAHEWYAPAQDEWTEREERITKVKSRIKNGEEVMAEWATRGVGAHKVMCMGPEVEIELLEKQLQSIHGRDIHVYRSRGTYLELAPRSISKASGLQQIVENVYGITLREVMSFGDNYNDIDLLRASGVGVAVENARQEVKAVADAVTRRSVEDGVALKIEEWLALQGR